MKSTWDSIISYGLIGLMFFSALAHGTVEPWSVLIFVFWVAALALLWAMKAAYERKLLVYVPLTVWPLAAFTLLGGAQSVAVQDRAGTLHSLSSDVEATRGATLLLGCLLMIALLAANFLAHRERLWRLAQVLTVFGVLLATFALIQYFTWNDRLYWFRASQAEAPFGPFVNRNHFAGYMELLLPWPVVVMMARHRREEKLFYGFAAAWMAMTAIFSQSRGGIVSVFAELMFLAALSPRGEQDYSTDYTGNRRFGAFLLRVGAIAAIVAATIGGVGWLGAERVADRIALKPGAEQSADSSVLSNYTGNRVELWRDSWALFRAHPVSGAGLGAFETVFPAFNQQTNPGIVTSQAHNDYLQVLTDGGMIGGAIALWFLITVGLVIWRGMRAPEPMMNLYALGCGAAIFGLLVHSLFDFNLQLPSHALLFIVFSAIAAQLSELATLLAGARIKARPIADAKRILLSRRRTEV